MRSNKDFAWWGRTLLPKIFLLCPHICKSAFDVRRRSWCPKWRRCVRQSSRESTCLALPLLPLLFHLLPSCPPLWFPLSTPCLPCTLLAQWVACLLIITHTIHITLRSTDPEPFQVRTTLVWNTPLRHTLTLYWLLTKILDILFYSIL